ncbi:MAG TPA: gamma carbonic anhydrase family protein [Rickettsiales bacterium]|nr:gamma carbonic anhydrase family protein [Rickettsiales bacterium]
MSFITRKFKDKAPDIRKSLYIADNCVIIGDVRLGKNVNIWSNCTLRADFASIIVDENTNIQENTVIHVDKYENEDYLVSRKGHVIIGKNTTIGHSCIIHSCKIGDNCLIGMGSIIGDDVVVEDGAFIGAGSNVTPNTIIRSGEMWFGNPARFMRQLRSADIQYMKENIDEYLELAKEYAE